MQLTDKSRTILRFGRSRLVPYRGELLVDGVPVDLGHRALEILLVLIEARGDLVTKDEILKRVWPGTVVEENTLQVHISALRKALGEDRDLLKTLSGRGYRFVADITTEAGAGEILPERGVAWSAPLPDVPPLTNLPEPVSELIGREAEIKIISGLALQHRLLTLAGAGGIGKTRLGVEVARVLLPNFADGVWIAELATLSDPELVPVTVASVLGLTLAVGALSPERVAALLGTKRVLLVLDNCEHVIDSAARVAEALLRANPVARVMATSREPLRARGECVYRVPPLEVPRADTQPAEDVLRHSAVRLFVARARAADPYFSLDQHTAAITGAICRRLDGIPLAIELAAARAPALGVEGLAARLDDRFRLLAGGHRTALPRHQTLRATLDWSYGLLVETERMVLRRLAVFAGGFTLESATAVAASAGIAASDVVDCVANLVAKSLLTADHGGTSTHYRLLETTRAYALEKLTDGREIETFARRHAEYFRRLLELAESEWESRPPSAWLAAYGDEIDNVRVALDWAFSPGGDAAIGVALTVAAVPLWIRLLLMDECHRRVETALSKLGLASALHEHHHMQLHVALGLSLLYTKGNVPETIAAWTSALEIAQRREDTEYQLRALFGLWTCRVSIPECQAALALAERFFSVAGKHLDPTNLSIGDRMVGVVLHYRGDQINARHRIERMLSRYVTPTYRSRTIRFQIDQQVAARAFLARILWLQGFPDQAVRTGQSNVEDARVSGHALSLCYALEAVSAVALFTGDLTAAERSVAMLLEEAEKHGFGAWHAWGGCFHGALLIKRGELVAGTRLLRSALDELREARFAARYTQFLSALAEGFGHAGQTADARAAIDDALARSERNDERWCEPELLRIKGEILLRQGDAMAAQEHFQQALEWARRQVVPSWELRTATSLGRLWREQRRTHEARELLAAVYSKFTEGFETIDLATAKVVLDELQ